MRRVWESLRLSLLSIARGLRVPGFYVLLLLLLLLWCAAYQQKQVYTVDLGGPGDNAYLSGFNDKEHNEALTYRWSGPSSLVTFPGIGNEPVLLSITTVGYRPDGQSPRIAIGVRDQSFELQTRPEPHTETFFLPRGRPLDGDLKVRIVSPVFSPSRDPRRLGVIVDRVEVSPARAGVTPLVIPPLATVASLALALVLVYFGVLVSVRRVAPALALFGGLGGIVAVLVVAARPELGLLGSTAPITGLWFLLMALLGRTLLDAALVGEAAAGVGAFAFALAFALRFGGTIYPQFLTSDIVLHVHNLQSVLRGNWLFTEPLPDGTPAPYPNGLYVLLAPAGLFDRSDAALSLVLEWSGSLFDSLVCLGLAWAGSRLWGALAGGSAALAYAISPAVFELLSAGNYTNIFAQPVLDLAFLTALVFLARRSRLLDGWVGFVVIASGFSLAMLGHYGVALALLAVLGLFLVWTIVETFVRGTAETGRSWAVLGAGLLGLVVSIAAYYHHFATEVWNQWSGLFRRLLGDRTGPDTPAPSRPDAGWLDFAERRSPLVGPLLLVSAVTGGLLGGRPRGYGPLLACWLLAALVFAALDRVVGDAVRWAYLAAAPLALLAGRFLASTHSRGRAGRPFTVLAFASILWSTLTFWIGDLIFTHYH